MEPVARAHYDRGLSLYAARDFLSAVDELERGFAVDPRREFLFAEAQALRLAGACERAVPLYERFLATRPEAVQVEAAQLGIDRCARTAAVRSPAPAAGTAAAATPGATGSTAPSAGPRPQPTGAASSSSLVSPTVGTDGPLWRDGWATAFVGAGVAALGTGVGFVVASNRARDDADAVANINYPEFDRLRTTAQHRRAIAVTALIGGAVLVGAGGARLAWLHHQRGREGARNEGVRSGGEPGADTASSDGQRVPPAPALSVILGDGAGALTWSTWF